MAVSWATRYRQLLTDITGRVGASDGYSLATVEKAERRLGVTLPQALRDYYLSVGRHRFNRVHNRLLAPQAVRIARRHLVFMEENQWVVYWGVLSKTPAANPTVFQTQDLDDEDEDWNADARCSEFLTAMLCWQAVSGGLRYIGYSDRVDSEAWAQSLKQWPLAGRAGGLSAFVHPGRVVCVESDTPSGLLHVGARSKAGFQAVADEIGVVIHEAW
jgi:hypothetical protein